MLRFSYHKKVNIQQILFFTNLLIFVGCAFYLGDYYYQGYRSESKIDELRSIMGDSEMAVISTESDSVNSDMVSSDSNSDGSTRSILKAYEEARQGSYPHLVGRIKIEGTPIDYFVMQTPDDPEYYLDKDVMGEPNKEGTPFIDVECDLEAPSNNVMIYAHAMKNQHQFGSLRKYNSEKYYKEHPIIQFETMYEPMCEYEIVAAFYAQVYDETDVNVFRYYYFFGCENERDFDYYIDNIKELSCYDTGIVPKFGDQLITLSTCNNEKMDMAFGRFVVVARKITDNNEEVNGDNSQEESTQEESVQEETTETEESGELTYDELINSLHTDEPVPTPEPTLEPEEQQETEELPPEESGQVIEEVDISVTTEDVNLGESVQDDGDSDMVLEEIDPLYLEIDVSGD